MSSGFKKFFIIFAIVIFLAAVGAGIYFGFSNKKTVPSDSTASGNSDEFPSSGQNSQSTGGQTQGSGGVMAGENDFVYDEYFKNLEKKQKDNLFSISSGEDINFWLASSSLSASSSATLKSDVYYLNGRGQVVKISGINQEEVIASSNFGEPLWLEQSADGSRILVKFNSAKFYLFETKTRVWQDLGDGLISASLLADGSRLAYTRENKDGRTDVYIKNLNSTKNNLTLLTSLNILDVELKYADVGRLFLLSKPSYYYSGQIWYIDINKKTLNPFSSGKGNSLTLSSFSDRVLNFVNSSASVQNIYLKNKKGEKLADISLSTISSKCSFALDADKIFCAVPRQNNKGAELVLPDDYLKKAVRFKDEIFEINLTNSQSFAVLDSSDILIDAQKIKSSAEQVFFINRFNNNLYLYNLNQK